MRKGIDTFIKEHECMNYCEAIIHKDGSIEYAKPTHLDVLAKLTYTYSEIPSWELCLLVSYTGCVATWYEGYMRPKTCTEKQLKALNKLIQYGLTKAKVLN